MLASNNPPDPGYADEEAGWEVVGDDVETHLPGQDHLEPRRAVVHTQSHVVFVYSPQRFEAYPENKKTLHSHTNLDL